MTRPAIPLPIYLIAGGRSLRMGSDKRSLRIAGRTLFDRALGLAGESLAAVVVRQGALPADLPTGTRCVLDAEGADAAPIHGLAAALTDARRSALPVRHILAVAIDLPLLRPETLSAVAAEAMGAPADLRVLLPEADGRLQPLAAAWSLGVLAEIPGALDRGEPSLIRLALAGGHRVLPAELLGARPDEFWNVNRPEDAARVEERLRDAAGGEEQA